MKTKEQLAEEWFDIHWMSPSSKNQRRPGDEVSKPREFWIEDLAPSSVLASNSLLRAYDERLKDLGKEYDYDFDKRKLIHVIEYSAFEQLRGDKEVQRQINDQLYADLEQLRAENHDLLSRNLNLINENAVAREALKNARSSCGWALAQADAKDRMNCILSATEIMEEALKQLTDEEKK